MEISVVTWGSEGKVISRRQNHKGTRRGAGCTHYPEVMSAQYVHTSKLIKFVFFIYSLLCFSDTSTKV